MASKPLTRKALQENLPTWGILVLESHHSPDFFMEWREHSFIKIVYALQGQGVLHAGKKQFDFAAKDILTVASGVPNRIVDAPSQPSSLYVLCVDPKLLSFDPLLKKLITTKRIARSDYLAHRVEAGLRRLLFQQTHGGTHASLAMAAATLEIFHLLTLKESSGKDPNGDYRRSTVEMLRYIDYLDSHFFEIQDIDTAAQQLGISRRTFTKRFRELTGKSWLEYVRGKAIEHATQLLVETSAPIASIAFECGFSDLSTFYRQFKAQIGVSPAAWRKQNRIGPEH